MTLHPFLRDHDLQNELERLEREIDDLRTRLCNDEAAHEQAVRGITRDDAPRDTGVIAHDDAARDERRPRRLARSSRLDSSRIGSRPLRVVSSQPDVLRARAASPRGGSGDDGPPEAA